MAWQGTTVKGARWFQTIGTIESIDKGTSKYGPYYRVNIRANNDRSFKEYHLAWFVANPLKDKQKTCIELKHAVSEYDTVNFDNMTTLVGLEIGVSIGVAKGWLRIARVFPLSELGPIARDRSTLDDFMEDEDEDVEDNVADTASEGA